MKFTAILVLLSILITSCGGNKIITHKEIVFTNQEFDINTFKGKWMNPTPLKPDGYRVFQENGYVISSNGSSNKYELRKDSIFIYYKEITATGRLINLTDKEVDILWGTKDPKERFKYFRRRK